MTILSPGSTRAAGSVLRPGTTHSFSSSPAEPPVDWSSTIFYGGAYGQSNSIPRGTARVSTDSPSNARMFNAGVWPSNTTDAAYVSDTLSNEEHNTYVAIRLASLIGFQEYTDLESLNSGIPHILTDKQFALASYGSGAKTTSDLSGGLIFLTNVANGAERASILIGAESKSIYFLPIPYYQGEAEAFAGTSGATWKTQVLALQRYMTDIYAAKSGQAVNLVPFITMQMVNSRYSSVSLAQCISIMQAQSDIAVENADVYSIGPSYWCLTSDNVHYTETYRRYISEKSAQIMATLIDGGMWDHCRITGATVAGTTITVSVHVPFGSLTEDTTLVTSIANKGFEVLNGSGAALTISSVTVGATVAQTAIVTIVVASGTPAKLRYALQDLAFGGATNGARGNLRDQDPTVATLDGHHLYNWLANAEVTL